MDARQIRDAVATLFTAMATTGEAEPEHFVMIGELAAQVLVDVNRIADALEKIAEQRQ